jgi:hypothetical protein
VDTVLQRDVIHDGPEVDGEIVVGRTDVLATEHSTRHHGGVALVVFLRGE